MNILIMNRKYNGVFGGVELMSTSLANAMADRGHECHIVSLDRQEAEMCYALRAGITWHRISEFPAEEKAGWGERFSRFQKIRNIIKSKHIDVAIGFQDGAYLSLVTAAFGTAVPVIAAERNSPSRFDFIKAGRLRHITFNSFRLARSVTVQCESYVRKYPSYLRDKIEVIPNPVFPVEGQAGNAKKIISVGRLSFQKNYAVLIESFAKLAADFPEWQLVIVGDGEDRKKIESQINALNLSGRIVLEGYQKDPGQYYRHGGIFCLSSRWEGFPNALAEAMAYGLPCVGFEECSGVSDLISHEKTGLLAPGNEDTQSLAGALRHLMGNEDLRIKMGSAARDSMSQYAPAHIYAMWEDLFNRIGGKN